MDARFRQNKNWVRFSLSFWVFTAIFSSAIGRAEPPAFASSKNFAAVLQPFVDQHQIEGAVMLVASKDKVLDLEAIGLADAAGNKRMAADNVFWIASMSKAMTASAIMMLVDEGKVSVDDPVEKFIPEFKNSFLESKSDNGQLTHEKPARPILVKHLLTHTSGLTKTRPLGNPASLAESVALYPTLPLRSQPGDVYDYNNAGINTLGRIVEVASGMPYEKFMDERLFKPLGMTETTLWPGEELAPRIAKAYKAKQGDGPMEEVANYQFIDAKTHKKVIAFPAGGYFSTAKDVSIFCQMVLNAGMHNGRRILSESSIREMTHTQTGDLISKGKGEAGYGYCWGTTQKIHDGPANIVGVCSHGGAFFTHMFIDPKRGIVFLLMTQTAGIPAADGGKIRKAYEMAVNAAYAK
jgi:CubicO group peptidase (beta-lactamase class C family)